MREHEERGDKEAGHYAGVVPRKKSVFLFCRRCWTQAVAVLVCASGCVLVQVRVLSLAHVFRLELPFDPHEVTRELNNGSQHLVWHRKGSPGDSH